MSQFQLSFHALEQMEMRGISEEIVFLVLNNPDETLIETEGQLIFQKKVLFDTEKVYLVRVFVNMEKNPALVKTVYRTSKFEKYN
jgi:Domain of unknown function (DUF4258)